MNEWRTVVLWLAIRFLGLFFLAKSLLASPVILTNALLLRSLPSEMQAATMDSGSVTQKLDDYVVITLVSAAGKFVLYGLLGLYLCRRGRCLYSFIRLPADRPEDTE